jgi:hypothetical protein
MRPFDPERTSRLPENGRSTFDMSGDFEAAQPP